MIVKLMTDAPKHNLALMKISAYYKAKGIDTFIGKPADDCDLSYGSWLFNQDYFTDFSGGTGTDHKTIRISDARIPENIMPDYSLYPDMDYSLGYTFEPCFRGCDFCMVKDTNTRNNHNSIRAFHNPEFKKICLLNNNTFMDPYWKWTFEEIWENDLTVIDENGYDLRLLDEEKLEYLNRTKFEGYVHFAFDRIEDETEIRRGLDLIKKHGINHRIHIYVMVGYPDWRSIDQTDFDRCEIIREYGYDPFIMVYNRHKNSRSPRKAVLNKFSRMVNWCFNWRNTSFQQAWADYWHS